jgi:hypothetical protein
MLDHNIISLSIRLNLTLDHKTISTDVRMNSALDYKIIYMNARLHLALDDYVVSMNVRLSLTVDLVELNYSQFWKLTEKEFAVQFYNVISWCAIILLNWCSLLWVSLTVICHALHDCNGEYEYPIWLHAPFFQYWYHCPWVKIQPPTQ